MPWMAGLASRRCATALALTAALIAVGAPIVLALYLADRQAREGAFNVVRTYARDVLHRSESATDQIASGFHQLQQESLHSGPCSPASAMGRRT
jgi:sensor c-di-GMP phosphodiesterase-like protein